MESSKVSFQKYELAAEGVDHNRALHINVKCGDTVIT